MSSSHHHWQPLPEQLPYPIDERRVERVVLQAESEARVEVDAGEHVAIELETGYAEIFGAELPRRMPVLKSGPAKFAIFSWQGATLTVKGKVSTLYHSADTPMVSYLNVHLILAEMRRHAQRNFLLGPTVVVTGCRFAGKSSLCHLLLNYGLKTGWAPLYADLNVKSNDLAPPGCVGVALPEFALPHQSLSARALCWFNGANPAPTAQDQPHFRELYTHQLGLLAASVKRRLAFNLSAKRKELLLPAIPPEQLATTSGGAPPASQVGSDLSEEAKREVPLQTEPSLFASGCVVNALAQTGPVSEELLMATVDAFTADLVIVMDDDRLFNALTTHVQRLTRKEKPIVLKLPKSGGVVAPPASAQARVALSRLSDYFSGPLRQFSQIELPLSLRKFHLYRVGGVVAPLTALPQGEARRLTHLQLTAVNPVTTPLAHRVLAALYLPDVTKALKLHEAADKHDSGSARDELCQLLLSANVAGLYLVKQAARGGREQGGGILNVLSPSDQEPPSPFLLVSELAINPLDLHGVF